MRIYEFAKKQGLESKELIAFLQGKGFDVASHMSVLDEKALAVLEKKYSSKDTSSKKTAKKGSASVKKTAQAPKKTTPKKSAEKANQVEEKKPTERALVNQQPAKQTIQKSEPLVAQQPVEEPIRQASPAEALSPQKHTRKEVVKQAPRRAPFQQQRQQRRETVLESVKSAVENPLVLRQLTVGDFAAKTGKAVSDIIVTLLKKGMVYTKNHLLTVDQVADLARTYELEITKATTGRAAQDAATAGLRAVGSGKERLPIVVVMGHVDHGKTTLLDYIRKTRVVAREKGGITQHLGAYEAQTSFGNIVFLDTPGHEAFSKIRHRGATIADLGVLVVAADDGVMPQTVESIKALKALEIPIVVAINKIDKVEKTRLEGIKRQLSQYDLLPEEWGGSVICVPISAKEGTGVDLLLEMLVLQSQMMDLRGALDQPGEGYILESKIEKGRGSVATVIFRHGTVHVGDFFVAGDTAGKIISMRDSAGSLQQSVGPSVPVVITGFDTLPSVGSFLKVVTEKEYRSLRSSSGQLVSEQQTARNSAFASASSSQQGVINLVVKADSNASLEALVDGIEKLNKTVTHPFFIIHSGVGSVTENDVTLAETAKALVIGFGVKADHNAVLYGRKAKVELQLFDIIYHIFEELEKESKSREVVKKVVTRIGEALVLKVFDIKKFGIVAGAYIKEGRFSEKGTVKIWRGKKMVGEGKIKSLQRDKKSVKEVHTGFECAFMVDGFTEWQIDDRVECYIEI